MNDAEREKLIDARVQRRLATDAAYRNAENAEEQSQREDEIEEQEVSQLNQEVSGDGRTARSLAAILHGLCEEAEEQGVDIHVSPLAGDKAKASFEIIDEYEGHTFSVNVVEVS